MKAAIAQLEVNLETLLNNEPINRAEGNTEQADLEAANASEIRQALAVLKAAELWRLVHQWRELAADARICADQCDGQPILDDVAAHLRADAAAGERHAFELETALRCEPRPQSGEEEVEECRARSYGGSMVWCERGPHGVWLGAPCDECPARGKRTERSAPPNV